MGKKISASTKKRRLGETWTGADHLERAQKSMERKGHATTTLSTSSTSHKKQKKKDLSHDTQNKREERKLHLHISHTKRQIERLKVRLEQWDDVAEKQRAKAEEEEERRRRHQEEEEAAEAGQDSASSCKKRRVRPGPETWKLRGAARPAWEVYDFDVRYVDPHVKAQEDARAKLQRCRNVLQLYKTQFHTPQAPKECREYLTLLMRLALLYRDAGNIKAARKVLLECIDLDSKEYPISLARCHLMRLYVQANRPESVQRLCDKLSHQDHSCWIQYTRVLMEYRNNKDDDKDDLSSVHAVLQQAMQHANIYCALYLAFGTEVFDSVVEYADEIEDATDAEPLEEAIEYCNSEQRQLWESEEGAIPWLQKAVLDLLKKKKKKKEVNDDDEEDDDYLNWKLKLQQMEEAAHAAQAESDAARKLEVQKDEDDDDNDNAKDGSDEDNNHDDQKNDDDNVNNHDDESVVDVLMFIVMFRTAMEMVEEKYGLSS